MEQEKYATLMEKKKALWAELSAIDEAIDEATTGQTFSDHNWKLDTASGLIEIPVNGEHIVHLGPGDVGDILSAFALVNNGKVTEIIAPFDVSPPAPKAAKGGLIEWLQKAEKLADKQKKDVRMYLRVRAGPDKTKPRVLPGAIEMSLSIQEMEAKVIRQLKKTKDPVVLLELMGREKYSKRFLFLVLRDSRTKSDKKG